MTVLHIASKNDEVDIVEYLVEKGADLEEKDDKGFTPTEYSSNDDILRFLINHGGKIESISATFHYAASCGNLHMVKYLLETMEANIEDRNEVGQTALHHSAYNSHEDVAKYLIVQKAKVNAKDFEGRTPLHIASSGVFDNTEVPDLLIKNGSNVNAVDNQGMTALHHASCRGRESIARFIIGKLKHLAAKDNDGMTALHHAALATDLSTCEVVNLLGGCRADVNAKDNNSLIPLHLACKSGRLPLVELLIELKADINAKDNDGVTPLGFASFNKNTAVKDTLIKKGAKI